MKLKIRLIKSGYGRIPKHRKTLMALGLTKMGRDVVKPDNPMVRGMIGKVAYLLKVEEVEDGA
ncbi:MAG: 50S ribosomal protein L30 [bacterium]|nr:50S ribosomal protein L30 [bacterium]